MVRGVKEWTDRHREAFMFASLCGAVIIYLGCVCGQGWNELYQKQKTAGSRIRSIWFMISMNVGIFAVLLILILWNWNNENYFLNHCAQYLAVGYALKMGIAIILQANLMCLAYMEFPFTGKDIAELGLPILLVYENYRRIKEDKMQAETTLTVSCNGYRR